MGFESNHINSLPHILPHKDSLIFFFSFNNISGSSFIKKTFEGPVNDLIQVSPSG